MPASLLLYRVTEFAPQRSLVAMEQRLLGRFMIAHQQHHRKLV